MTTEQFFVHFFLFAILLASSACICPIGTFVNQLDEQVGDLKRIKSLKNSSYVIGLSCIAVTLIGVVLGIVFAVDDESVYPLIIAVGGMIGYVIGWFVSLRIAGVQITLHPMIIVAPKPTTTLKNSTS